MKKILSKVISQLEKLYDKKVSASGLALFRITYFTVLAFEVIHLIHYKELIFDRIPFIDPFELNFDFALYAWVFICLLLTLGLFTKTAKIINYIFTLVFFSTISNFEYHMFYAYTGINFLVLFIPIEKALSLDNLLKKLKYSNTRYEYSPTSKTTVLSYYSLLVVGVGIVYLDSVFHKLTSHYWTHGIGFWLPSSLPQFTLLNDQWFLNQKWLVLSMGIGTIIFEAIFCFTFFIKKLRLPIFVIGVLLHVGILLEFPIPLFAFGVMSLYLLVLPISFLRRIKDRLVSAKPSLQVYYDRECPLCVRTKLTVEHFDFQKKINFLDLQSHFKAQEAFVLNDITFDQGLDDLYSVDLKGKTYKGIDTYLQICKRHFFLFPLCCILKIPGIYHLVAAIYKFIASNRNTERCNESNCGYTPPVVPTEMDDAKILRNFTLKQLKIRALFALSLLLLLLQLNVTFKTPFFSKVKNMVLPPSSSFTHTYNKYSLSLSKLSKELIGITTHPVFMDGHYRGYNHIVRVEYTDTKGKTTNLPIIDEKGQPGPYLRGANWVNWTFRIVGTYIRPNKFSQGLERYTSYWLYKEGIKDKDGVFKIFVKKIIISRQWENNYLKKLLDAPWQEVGAAHWEGAKFNLTLPDIEKI